MAINGNGANGVHNGGDPASGIDDDDPPFVKRLREELRSGKQPPSPPANVREPLRIRSFAEIDFDVGTEAWLVEDLLLTEEISMLHGPTNSGKTFLGLDLSLSIAAGGEWFGRKVTQGNVCYVAAEGGRRVDKRIAAWKRRRGYLRKGEALPFLLIAEPVDLCHAEAGDVERIIDAVRSMIGDAPLALIVIETINSVLNGGNENGPEDMGRLVAHIKRLRDVFHCAVLLIHHPSKSGPGSRGHYSLPCAVDTEFTIAKDEESGVATVTMTKQREAEKVEPFHFQLEVVELGHSTAGKPVTSCVISEADEPEKTGDRPRGIRPKLAPREQIALTQLTNAINIAGIEPHSGRQALRTDQALARILPGRRDSRQRKARHPAQGSRARHGTSYRLEIGRKLARRSVGAMTNSTAARKHDKWLVRVSEICPTLSHWAHCVFRPFGQPDTHLGSFRTRWCPRWPSGNKRREPVKRRSRADSPSARVGDRPWLTHLGLPAWPSKHRGYWISSANGN